MSVKKNENQTESLVKEKPTKHLTDINELKFFKFLKIVAFFFLSSLHFRPPNIPDHKKINIYVYSLIENSHPLV